jgi:hypothetical protein
VLRARAETFYAVAGSDNRVIAESTVSNQPGFQARCYTFFSLQALAEAVASGAEPPQVESGEEGGSSGPAAVPSAAPTTSASAAAAAPVSLLSGLTVHSGSAGGEAEDGEVEDGKE